MMNVAATAIGFIGLGLMGTPIAIQLCKAGYDVRVWARSPEKLTPAREAGATVADSPAATAADADVIFLCVTDTDAVEAIVFGDNGVAKTGRKGAILVDHSSIRPDSTVSFANRLKKTAGMHWIDAPVSGGAPAVFNKSLVVMAGADNEELIERIRPLTGHYAGRVTHMGPVGAGQTTKLVNQTLVGVNFALLAEVVAFAANAGIDAAKLPGALAGGRADSRLFQEFLPRMLQQDPPREGRIDIVLKDLDMVADAAKANGTPMPLAMLAGSLHRMLVAKGFGNADNAELPRLYRPDSAGSTDQLT